MTHVPSRSPREARPAVSSSPGTVPVVACVARRGERYLVALRPDGKRHGGCWEFPGGKLRPGEDRGAAGGRELAEELRLEVLEVGAALWTRRDPGSPFLIDFVEAVVRGEPEALEHQAVGWYTVQELEALPLAPADAAFVARLAGAGERPPPLPSPDVGSR